MGNNATNHWEQLDEDLTYDSSQSDRGCGQRGVIRSQNGASALSRHIDGLEVAARILAAQTNMSANLLTDGVLNTDEGWGNLLQGIETAGNADLWIRYTPRLTPEKLRAMAHKAKMEHGMEMLVVDYLQLMRGDGKTANRQEEVVMLCVPST